MTSQQRTSPVETDVVSLVLSTSCIRDASGRYIAPMQPTGEPIYVRPDGPWRSNPQQVRLERLPNIMDRKDGQR